MRRRVNRLRHKLVPRIRKDAALSCDRAQQSVEHKQRACHRPSVTDARSHAAPVVARETCTCGSDEFRDLFDRSCVDPGFLSCEFESVFRVKLFENVFELFEALMSDKLQFVARGIFGARLFDKLKFVGHFIAP